MLDTLFDVFPANKNILDGRIIVLVNKKSELLACGSRSMSRTFFSYLVARTYEILMQLVVLPQPPLTLKNAMVFIRTPLSFMIIIYLLLAIVNTLLRVYQGND